MPGYPDWQRVQTRVQTALFRNTALSVPVSVVEGPWMVANLERVLVIVSATGTSYYTCRIDWWLDQAMTQNIGGVTIQLLGGPRPYAESLAVASPFMSVTITALSFVGGDTVSLQVIPNSNAVVASALTSPFMIDQANLTVAHGSTSSFIAATVQPGRAQWVTQTASPSSDLFVDVWTQAGTWESTYAMHVTAVPWNDSRTIILPNAPVRGRITNSDTVDHTYNFLVASFAS